ncbi:MAG: DUF2752 domain-containing protein [Defluviitaleaceae bacterium]|nr:DUF2752 domain-containing protein [Defluviitaleaceae bacterium]
MSQLITVLKDNRIGLIVLGIYLLLAQLIFGYICPSMWLLGLPCPACGLTRAAFSLIRLDFRGAAAYNPMIFAALPAFYFYHKKYLIPFAIIVLALFVVFFVRINASFGVEPLIINRNALIHILLGGFR